MALGEDNEPSLKAPCPLTVAVCLADAPPRPLGAAPVSLLGSRSPLSEATISPQTSACCWKGGPRGQRAAGPGRPRPRHRTLRARHPGRAQRNKALPCPPGGGATPFSPHRLHPEAPRELERGAFQDEPSGGECEAQGTGHWDSEVGRKGCGGRDSRFSGWQGRLCPRVTLLHSNLLPQHLASKKTRILLSFPACSSSARPHPPGTPTPPSAPREAELAGPARAAAHRLRAG